MRRGLAAALAGPAVAGALFLALGWGDQAAGAPAPEVIGHSVGGRPIEATQVGDPSGERVALVVGVIHGDEKAGLRVIEAIRRSATALEGTQLWLIRTVNPDGLNLTSRKNANEVDLNRNFPFRWRPGGKSRDSGYYPGPAPASEPETKAVMDFVKRIRPDVSVWYHQDWDAVLACKGRPEDGVMYARLVPMRTSCRGNRLHGTAVSWQQHAIRGSDAFVVELAARVSAGQVTRHMAAALGVARDG
jgi:protein MpaA